MQTSKATVLLLTTLAATSVRGLDLEVVASLTDGSGPRNELVQGPGANFYGTTYGGGSVGVGTIFRVSPLGALTTLVTFNGANGAWPIAGLAFGSDGNLWGTCAGGVAGDLFSLTLDGQWTNWFPFFYASGSYPEGQQPEGTLVLGNDGYLYGTASGGGAYTLGTVFRVGSQGQLTVVAPLPNWPGPNEPHAGLVLGNDGTFYGTTTYGGSPDLGTVFRVSTNGLLGALASFHGPDGAKPRAALVQGRDGNFYGTTSEGGTNGSGTIFRITTNGVLTSMVSFDGSTGGANPKAKLFLAPDGNFYGTTSAGGASGLGTVFRFTPDGTLTTLASFSGFDGATPLGGLILATDGRFYGTTSEGGDLGQGVVYRLAIPLNVIPTINSFSVTSAGPGIQLQFIGTPGQPYVLQAATNLVPPVQWVPIVTNLPSPDGHWQFVDTNTTSSQKFYRAVSW